MKAVLTTICLVALLVGGCSYVGFTGGYGGESESPNYSMEFRVLDDVRPLDPNRVMLLGGVMYIDNEDVSESGVFIKLGYEAVPDSGFFVNVIAGMSFYREDFGYMYDPDGEDGPEEPRWRVMEDQLESDVMFGGGFTYFFNDGGTAIIASYDNKRGLSAGVGFRY